MGNWVSLGFEFPILGVRVLVFSILYQSILIVIMTLDDSIERQTITVVVILVAIDSNAILQNFDQLSNEAKAEKQAKQAEYEGSSYKPSSIK